jgi:hypothetical protein
MVNYNTYLHLLIIGTIYRYLRFYIINNQYIIYFNQSYKLIIYALFYSNKNN